MLFGGYTGSFQSDTWEWDAGLPATFSTFGTGCASTATLPTISGTPPNLGQNFTLEIKGFLPKPQFGQLVFGVSNTKWGLLTLPFSLAVLGMGNCNLLVSPDMSSPIATDARGSFKTTTKRTWGRPTYPRKYERLWEHQLRIRKALREGSRVYDRGLRK